MTVDAIDYPSSRSLEAIFKEHLDNTIACGEVLSGLFSSLENPDAYIVQVKQLEEKGDKLTAEAFCVLELLTYSELVHVNEQLVKRLDDIVDGINNTARLIDICQPRQIENAAHDILATLLSMIANLRTELTHYPDNAPESVKTCCKALKQGEEEADIIYHEWRKKQRRVLVLSLIEENNWTEILGVLEETTDAAYHAGLLLERITRYRRKQ